MPGSPMTCARQGLSLDTRARSGVDNNLIGAFLTECSLMYFNGNCIPLPDIAKFRILFYSMRFCLQWIIWMLVAATPAVVASIPKPPNIDFCPLRRLKV